MLLFSFKSRSLGGLAQSVRIHITPVWCVVADKYDNATWLIKDSQNSDWQVISLRLLARFHREQKQGFLLLAPIMLIELVYMKLHRPDL